MSTPDLWFVLIAALWTGFFVLEGFDFGVGMLHGVIGRDEMGRRAVINTIAPVWDGNEVWLIVAGAGMFAAFPDWYATMFSGFYVALVLLLMGLIVRGVSFEFRGKRESARWRGNWDLAMIVASVLVPLLIGVALADLLHGVPIGSNGEFTGTFWDLLSPYALLVGVTMVVLCAFHGATFVTLKTAGEIHDRAGRIARGLGPVAAAFVAAAVLWTQGIASPDAIRWVPPAIALAAVCGAVLVGRRGRDGRAFALTAVATGAVVVTLFADLFPRVMVSSTNAAYDLTVANAASSPYALKVMTIVAVIFLPLVLLYQAWTYVVFRRRLWRDDIADATERASVTGEPTAPPFRPTTDR